MIKNLPDNAGDIGSILGLGRCPGEGGGNLLQCSCLGNPTDRGACWATVHGVQGIGHDFVAEHTCSLQSKSLRQLYKYSPHKFKVPSIRNVNFR